MKNEEYTFSREDYINGYIRACKEILEYINKKYYYESLYTKQKGQAWEIYEQIKEMIYWSEE